MNNTDQIIAGNEVCGHFVHQHERKNKMALGRLRSFCRTGIVIGALLAGGLAPSRGATLFQRLQDTVDSLVLGTNSSNGVSITLEPLGVTNLLGTSLTLITAATGPDLQYQWSLNGYPIAGATNASLLINNLTLQKCGAYQVTVFNSLDVDWSTVANVQPLLLGLPVSDAFTNRPFIVGISGAGVASMQNSSRESADPKPSSGTLYQTLWMKWVAPLSGPVEMNTIGSAVDTWVGVYTGSVQSNLVAVARDDDTGEFGTSSVEFNAQIGTTYQILIGTRVYSSAPIVFSWNQSPLTSPLPTITSTPTNITTTIGSPASMTVQYQSSIPATLQWYHNDKPIAGATQNTLSWSQLTLADLGTYQAVLTSAQWVYQLQPVEIQFNTEGLTTVGARKKLVEAITSGLIGN